MADIVLIACASKKLEHEAAAEDLYVSPLFKKNLDYARSINPDKIFILSAKHGLVELDREVEPYNETLNEKNWDEIGEWADRVVKELAKVSDLESDNFIFLAGERYRKLLIPHLQNFEVPMKGLGIGKQLKWLKDRLDLGGNCHEIHQRFNSLPKLKFPFSGEEIPKNGIYILFEKGEVGHGGDRIVRVGTHTGVDQLRSRLFQHFLNENKDRSIFRKNIGRALLNKRGDFFLEKWELDLTSREAKDKHSPTIDFEKQREIEKEVSDYIRSNFFFVVFPVDDKDARLELEAKIISTVSLCEKCGPSEKWLGRCSSKDKICKSGLWLVNELWKEPLGEKDMDKLKGISGG